jgi:peptidoglycan/LPS O-acetylase OafA/YrhL
MSPPMSTLDHHAASRPAVERRPFPRLGHRPGLDGIRGIAVSLVVLSHAFAWAPGGGPAGVALFFVLSGFLITTLLVEEEDAGGIRLGAFYLRRALRLVPALTVLTAVVVAVTLAVSPVNEREILKGALAGWTYTADIYIFLFRGVLARPVAHLWTLSIEEQFYLGWPLILAAFCRRWGGVLRLLGAAIALVLVLEAGRWAIVASGRTLSHIPFTWLQALLLGCAGGLAFSRMRLPTRSLASCLLPGIAGILLVTFLPTPSGAAHAALLTVLSASCAAVVLSAAEGPAWFHRTLSADSLVWLGRRSYGLYLWHVPILEVARHFDPELGLATAAVAIAISIGVTEVSYRFVEKPFLRLKRR